MNFVFWSRIAKIALIALSSQQLCCKHFWFWLLHVSPSSEIPLTFSLSLSSPACWKSLICAGRSHFWLSRTQSCFAPLLLSFGDVGLGLAVLRPLLMGVHASPPMSILNSNTHSVNHLDVKKKGVKLAAAFLLHIISLLLIF